MFHKSRVSRRRRRRRAGGQCGLTFPRGVCLIGAGLVSLPYFPLYLETSDQFSVSKNKQTNKTQKKALWVSGLKLCFRVRAEPGEGVPPSPLCPQTVHVSPGLQPRTESNLWKILLDSPSLPKPLLVQAAQDHLAPRLWGRPEHHPWRCPAAVPAGGALSCSRAFVLGTTYPVSFI